VIDRTFRFALRNLLDRKEHQGNNSTKQNDFFKAIVLSLIFKGEKNLALENIYLQVS